MLVTAAGDAVIDGVDVDAVVTAVRGCPGVHDLHGGLPQMTATYLPGRRIEGVRVDPLAVAVQVRARWGVPVSELSTQIRAALRPVVAGRGIDIIWADVADPPPPAPMPAPMPAPTPAPTPASMPAPTPAPMPAPTLAANRRRGGTGK